MADETINLHLTAKDDASKVIDSIDKKIDALTKQKAEIEVGADTKDAQKQLAAIDKQLDALAKQKQQIEVDAKVNKALSALDDVADEAKKTEVAVEALSKALGPELTAKINVGAAVSDFQKMGLSLDDITDNADRLGTKLKEIDALNINPKVDTTGLERVHKEAGDTADTFQRGVGPLRGFTDELGGTSQAAGTAANAFIDGGEAIQVFGEKLGLSESALGAISGVVAGVGIAVAVGIAAWSAYNKKSQETAKLTKESSKALEEQLGLVDKVKDINLEPATTAAEAFNKSLITNDEDRQKAIRSLGTLGKTSDQLGQTMIDLERNSQGTMEALLAGVGVTGKLNEATAKAVNSTEDWATARNLLSQEGFTPEEIARVEKYARALEELNDQQQKQDTTTVAQQTLDYARGIDTTTAALVDKATATALAKNADADAVDILNEFVPLEAQHQVNLDAAAVATKDFAKAQNQLQSDLDAANTALDEQVTALEGQLEASQNAADSGIAFQKAQENLTEATANTVDVLKKHKAGSKEAQKAIEDERDAVIDAANSQQKLAEDTASASGATVTATQHVDGLNASLEEQAKSATPAARQAAYDYLIQLNQIPPEKATEIQAAVNAGDLDTANRLIDEASRRRQTAIEVDANTDPAMRKLKALASFIEANFPNVLDLGGQIVADKGGVIGPGGGIAGERRSEILNGRFITTGPTVVPPGTRVTSGKRTAVWLRRQGLKGYDYRRPKLPPGYDRGTTGAPMPIGGVTTNNGVTVNVNAAVIGNRFDVMRAVRRATYEGTRLLGSRT